MKSNWKYLVAVALLAVLAIVFGFAGTLAPISEAVSPKQSSSSDSVTHFINPPTYDSGWVDIKEQTGRSFGLRHGLNTTQVFVDVRGKRRFNVTAGDPVWKRAYGGVDNDYTLSMVQTVDLGYALAGYTESYGAGGRDFWLVKTDATGVTQWNETYGDTNNERAYSIVQTGDGGYALAGYTNSFGAGSQDYWLVKTDATGAVQWSQTYGGATWDIAFSVADTSDGGYALAGYTNSFGEAGYDLWLVTTDVESGLVITGISKRDVILYRAKTDPYWNYVRVRIWLIEEPTWQFGDINQDGVVDIQDLAIVSQNYGKTFSLLSLTGIVAIAGVHTYKRRKQQDLPK